MSASFEKKKRQEEKDSGMITRKQEQENKRIKDDKKQKRTIAIILAAVLVFVIFTIVFSSSLFYTHFNAVEIDGEEFTVADFNYYYYGKYQEFQQYMGSVSNSLTQSTGADMSGTATSISALKTTVLDEETGQTYAEAFESEALHTMEKNVMLCHAAEKDGFTLSEKELQEVDNNINFISDVCTWYGYANANSYLSSNYGKGMNTEIFKKDYTMDMLAAAYSEHKQNSFEYDESEIRSHYDDARDNYDIYEYRTFFVNGKDDETRDATEESMAAAHDIAVEFESKITDEKSFIDLAYEYAEDDVKKDYKDPSRTFNRYAGLSQMSYYKEWLSDPSRKEGDTYVAESPVGYYVVYFISRDSNEYNTRDALLIKGALASLSESSYDSTEEYNKALEEKKSSLYDTLSNLYDEWQEKGATDEAFDELASTNSYEYENGSFIKEISKVSYSNEITNWLFDPSRVEGDHDIIYSEVDNAYYLIVYKGENVPYWYSCALKDMRTDAYNAWEEEMMTQYTDTAKTSWLMTFSK